MTLRIRRVTTTRAGGVSVALFDSFNLGDHVGDDPAAVAANRDRLASAPGLPADHVVWMNQIHGDHVETVEAARRAVRGHRRPGHGDSEAGLWPWSPPTASRFLMADARAGVVGAAHAGRVGAAQGVVLRTLEAMLALGAHAGDVSVLLGPAVSGPNYEVPEEMAADVEASLPGSRTRTPSGTPALDLRGDRPPTGRRRRHRDRRRPRCTVVDPMLFSHRRDALTGRLASLIWME